MFITIALIPLLRRLAFRLNVLDTPDERKVHSIPTPRIGGVAMALGAIVPVILWTPVNNLVEALLIGSGIIVVLGAVDDWKSLNYRIKFAGQVAAALVVILHGDVLIRSLGALTPGDFLLPDWLAIPLTLVVIVGVTNAINLADGLDGLAGGITLLSFVCIGYLAYQADNNSIALVGFAVSGAIFGFLRFNSYPAVIFMGDAGSQFLGFMAITTSLSLTQGNSPLSPLVPLLLLGFPVLDTLTVMLKRIADGRSPFYPDKNHFHHRLIKLGFVHSEAVLIIYIVQAFLATSAFFFRYYSEWLLLVIYLVFSGIVWAVFHRSDRKGWVVKRHNFLDQVIKGKLRVLRDKRIIVKVSFRIIEYGLPALLLLTCLAPSGIPEHYAYFSTGLLVCLILAMIADSKILPGLLRLSLYLAIPFIVYQSEANAASWMTESVRHAYSIAFGIMVAFMLLTLRFSMRAGFKGNPMDFLILFIAVIVPILPDEQIRSYGMGQLAVKIIILYFGFEVLFGELRGKIKKLGGATIAALAVVSIRGFWF